MATAANGRRESRFILKDSLSKINIRIYQEFFSIVHINAAREVQIFRSGPKYEIRRRESRFFLMDSL